MAKILEFKHNGFIYELYEPSSIPVQASYNSVAVNNAASNAACLGIACSNCVFYRREGNIQQDYCGSFSSILDFLPENFEDMYPEYFI